MLKLFKIKYCLIVLLLSFASNSIASDEISEWTIKFGGWSKHSEEKNMAGRDWNENHMGFGLKKTFKDNERSDLFIEGFYMKDSYNLNSGYFGGGIEHTIPFETEYLKIKINAMFGILQRSLHNYYEDSDVLESTTEIKPSFMYYLTFEVKDRYEIDFTYIPKGTALIENEVFFFRLGYRF